MTLRQLNHKRNQFIRKLRAKAAKFLFDYKNKNRFTPSKLKEIKKIIFLRNDNKLGDMIVSTISFREIKKRLPKAELCVIAGPNSAKIIENNRNISHIYIYKKGLLNIIKLGLKLRREKFDLYIDIDRESSSQSILLLRLLRPKFAFGFNRQDFKMYNITTQVNFANTHITQCHKMLLKALRIFSDNDFNSGYDIFVPPMARKAAEKFLKTLPSNKRIVIFNPFAASKHRCFSYSQAEITARTLSDSNIIIIGPAQSVESFGSGEKWPENMYKAPFKTAEEYGPWLSIALLKSADLLITPDTYIIHAAAAFDKPIYALYGPNDGSNWYPLSDNKKIIVYDKDFSEFDLFQLIGELKKPTL